MSRDMRSYRQHQVQDEKDEPPTREESFQLREGDHGEVLVSSFIDLFFSCVSPLPGSTSAAGNMSSRAPYCLSEERRIGGPLWAGTYISNGQRAPSRCLVRTYRCNATAPPLHGMVVPDQLLAACAIRDANCPKQSRSCRINEGEYQ